MIIKHELKLFWIAVFSCCVIQFGHCEKSDFPFKKFTRLNSENGLAGSRVFYILQTKNGFMWFITDLGLNRYDGFSFTNFVYSSKDSNTIAPGSFYFAVEDSEERIWISSHNQGLYVFNQRTEKFVQYKNIPGNSHSLASDMTNSLAIDKNGIMWIGVDGGIDAFDSKKNIFTHYIPHKGDSTSLSDGQYITLCLDGRNDLWVLSAARGIDIFNTVTRKVTRHINVDLPGQKINAYNNSFCFNGRNGNVFIAGNDNFLYEHIKTTGEIKKFSCKGVDEKEFFNINFVVENSDGNMFMLRNNEEWLYLDRATSRFLQTVYTSKEVPVLTTLSYFLDDNNTLWLGTDNGVVKSDYFQNHFFNFQHDEKKKNGPSDNCILSFFENNHQQIMIGSFCMDLFDKAGKNFKRMEIKEGKQNILESNINCIYEDRQGILWFGTYDGLISYNQETGSYKRYNTVSPGFISLDNYAIKKIRQDKNENYWCTSTEGKGLLHFDPVNGKFTSVFTEDKAINSIITGTLSDLFIDSHNLLYIGAWDGGLVTFDFDKNIYKSYRHNSRDSLSISSDMPHDFMESDSGYIWFGTSGGGINVFNPATGVFKSFTVEEGLINNFIVSLIKDDKGKYWAGTYGGISSFTPPSNPFSPDVKIVFRNYNVSDGLPGNDLFPSAVYKDHEGDIFFGTRAHGFFYFNPDELRDNANCHAVVITNLKVLNKTVLPFDKSGILRTSVENASEIKLRYDENTISFSFSALNYLHPEKNNFAYMLEGFDKSWIQADADHRLANYTNLNPGSYVFKVKGCNNDGVWNNKITTLTILITPPFWQTIWFRSLILVLIIIFIYGLYRFRIQQIVKLQSLRNKIAADLHDDIGSTLNSISVYSQVAKQDVSKSSEALDMIGDASRKITDAMSDIVWTINPVNDSFENIIERMRSLSYNLLRAKNIDFTFKADENLQFLKLSMEIRRNLFLIFKEALNNLIKYSKANRVSIIISKEKNYMKMVVRDNGKGFDTSIIPKGNGLNNMNMRATEMNAILNIESIQGAGTTIELKLKT